MLLQCKMLALNANIKERVDIIWGNYRKVMDKTLLKLSYYSRFWEFVALLACEIYQANIVSLNSEIHCVLALISLEKLSSQHHILITPSSRPKWCQRSTGSWNEDMAHSKPSRLWRSIAKATGNNSMDNAQGFSQWLLAQPSKFAR